MFQLAGDTPPQPAKLAALPNWLSPLIASILLVLDI